MDHFMYCFPEDLFEMRYNNVGYMKDIRILRPIIASDWERPSFYFHRGRSLSVRLVQKTEEKERLTISAAFERLCTDFPEETIFPNLRHLILDGARNHSSTLTFGTAEQIRMYAYRVTLGGLYPSARRVLPKPQRATSVPEWTDGRASQSTLDVLWPGLSGIIASGPVAAYISRLFPTAKIGIKRWFNYDEGEEAIIWELWIEVERLLDGYN
ncbi:hypothetical protein C8R43DRAFT_1191836 [Mycena crocata]|nr:hypothetical protein C8R43DRAFT_1191836 [Mycena crocata]